MNGSQGGSGDEAKGFTLIELMIVVALFSVLASLALMSIGRTNRGNAVDGFAIEVRNAMVQARRRAIATRMEYLLVVTANSVQYCQATNLGAGPVVNPLDQAINWGLVPTDCSAVPATAEQTRPIITQAGAEAVNWSREVDTGQAVAKVALPATLYFNPDGTVYSKITSPPPTPLGFTLYIRGTSENAVVRKVLVYPFGGRPRIIDQW